ncbi:LuxR C-terminal-related transcriptional regulator [Vibrio sp. ZSDZ34]|uniref:LuxR C-terminal-related transcriptional regulator n=1 Tax=Vibrio gelatinilyticus TaxID=2893468 RepID=A0A9X2AUS3_9VIBR|nr:LuxR C-terminal-related transcriptional regulator [Vibrio gelatinilyticus]MCJ2376194.1 LuxR C-terminal-related transcriptional regulator [Vibrio gelatinilyticus]
MATVTRNARRAILLADNNLQSSLLKESIEKKVALEIRLMSPERLTPDGGGVTASELDFLIIDYLALGERHLRRYLEFKESLTDNVQEVLINTPEEIPNSELLKWQNLVGVFYTSDTLDTLTQGFNCILDGEMWMSRKLVFEYIKLYRERQCLKTSPSYTNLTKREQQIIKLLGDGASNTQIAEELFVSENTVKAHLHNTFKKIKVKNRVQALLWVKNNIASKEFV